MRDAKFDSVNKKVLFKMKKRIWLTQLDVSDLKLTQLSSILVVEKNSTRAPLIID